MVVGVETLDDVEADDDVETELDVDTLVTKSNSINTCVTFSSKNIFALNPVMSTILLSS